MASLSREGRGAPWLALLIGAVAVVIAVIAWLAVNTPVAEEMAVRMDLPPMAPRLPDTDSLPDAAPLPIPTGP